MRSVILGDSGNGPLLAFLPGMDGTGELLVGTARRLEERFRLVRFRYEDEGRAPGAELYVRLAATAAEALEGLGAGPALVLAESFGGGVALQLALDAPERVRGLMLVNTFARYPRRVRARLGGAAVPLVPQWAMRAGRDLLGRQVFFRPRRDAEAEAEFLRRATGFEDAGFAARLRALRHLDLVDRLGEIDVPCRLFASTHDRVVPSTRTMGVLRERLPRAVFEAIPRAGHIVLPLPEEPWLERVLELDEAATGG